MKVGVVTVHNSHNCGSYLQAMALCKYINDIGYDARFIKNIIHLQSRFSYKLLVAGKCLIKMQPKKAFDIVKGSLNFIKARRNFSYFSSCSAVSACVYGSDTIWNINSKHLKKQSDHYFGVNYKGAKIAYAPSIGDTPVDTILSNRTLCSSIQQFSHISVRDSATRKLLLSICDKATDVPYVVDPTMLVDRTYYESIASHTREANFILLYYFGALETSYLDAIKKYAEINEKKVICFGNNVPCTYKNIPFSPLDMLGYYSKADLIVTNTFHGNVFSLIFNKPFVNIDAGKAKVNDLLEDFELSRRTCKKASDFFDIVQGNIDFDRVNELLAEKKKASGDYLQNALKKCEEEMNNAR